MKNKKQLYYLLCGQLCTMVIITFRTMANKADVAMVRDIAGMIMITDLTDVWNYQAHSALPVGQLQKEGAEKPALIYTYICLLFLTPAHTDIIHQPCKCNTVFSCIYITAAISKFYASAYFHDFIFKAIYINRTLDCFRFFSFHLKYHGLGVLEIR